MLKAVAGIDIAQCVRDRAPVLTPIKPSDRASVVPASRPPRSPFVPRKARRQRAGARTGATSITTPACRLTVPRMRDPQTGRKPRQAMPDDTLRDLDRHSHARGLAGHASKRRRGHAAAGARANAQLIVADSSGRPVPDVARSSAVKWLHLPGRPSLCAAAGRIRGGRRAARCNNRGPLRPES